MPTVYLGRQLTNEPCRSNDSIRDIATKVDEILVHSARNPCWRLVNVRTEQHEALDAFGLRKVDEVGYRFGDLVGDSHWDDEVDSIDGTLGCGERNFEGSWVEEVEAACMFFVWAGRGAGTGEDEEGDISFV